MINPLFSNLTFFQGLIAKPLSSLHALSSPGQTNNVNDISDDGDDTDGNTIDDPTIILLDLSQGDAMAIQTNQFSSNSIADSSLEKILDVIGAKKNFVLSPCSNINNVIATSFKGVRYILYDKAFMQAINSRTNNWSGLTILAHEVGHHINGHSLGVKK